MMFESIGCATGRAKPTQAILMRTDHQHHLCERSRNESSLLGLDHPLRDISFTARNERKSDQSNKLFKKKCRATKKTVALSDRIASKSYRHGDFGCRTGQERQAAQAEAGGGLGPASDILDHLNSQVKRARHHASQRSGYQSQVHSHCPAG